MEPRQRHLHSGFISARAVSTRKRRRAEEEAPGVEADYLRVILPCGGSQQRGAPHTSGNEPPDSIGVAYRRRGGLTKNRRCRQQALVGNQQLIRTSRLSYGVL